MPAEAVRAQQPTASSSCIMRGRGVVMVVPLLEGGCEDMKMCFSRLQDSAHSVSRKVVLSTACNFARPPPVYPPRIRPLQHAAGAMSQTAQEMMDIVALRCGRTYGVLHDHAGALPLDCPPGPDTAAPRMIRRCLQRRVLPPNRISGASTLQAIAERRHTEPQ